MASDKRVAIKIFERPSDGVGQFLGWVARDAAKVLQPVLIREDVQVSCCVSFSVVRSRPLSSFRSPLG